MRSLAVLGSLAAGLAGAPTHAAEGAGDFPVRPLRLVSPFAAGGSTDLMGRTLAPRLSERLGQPVIVENRPGAGGMIGASHVAKATPDGYTMLFLSGAYTAHAATVSPLPYDPIRDFAWVSLVQSYPFAVVVRPESAVRSIADLAAAAKRNPAKMNYASVGVGSVFHLAAELFNVMAGTDLLHVPYKGGAEPITELIGGRIDVIFTTLPGISPHVRANRVRLIAVCSPERSAQFPDVPTVAQTLPGYEVTSFSGIATTRGTPRAVVARLNRDLHAVLELPEIRRLIGEQGGTPKPGSPEDMRRHVEAEIVKWKRVVAERRIEIQ